MPSIIPNEVTVAVLRKLLTRDGYKLEPPVPIGAAGADIVAQKDDERVVIEVIGFKSNQPLRTRDFNHALFQALAWLGKGAPCAVIAVPSRFKDGLPKRAENLGNAWVRIGNEFQGLEIWLVDTEKKSYTRTRWNDWAQTQEPDKTESVGLREESPISATR